MKLKTLLSFVLLVYGFCSFGQNSISGTVTDTDGNPVIGATVRVIDTGSGAITDIDGSFTLSEVSAGDVIQASFVGMSTETYTVAEGDTSHDFILNTDQQALEEIVVIGYGEVEKDDLTGSVTAITEEEFNQGSITTPQQLLQGKVAGVQVVPGNGVPGSSSQIRIRGGASLSASNDPLIVIDGVPISNDGIAGSANILNSINPNDIATFTVLKDASATAIYGSRASNGVIMITTKQGQSGKPKFTFSTLNSINTIADQVDVLGAEEFRNYVQENGSQSEIERLGGANTDWQEAIFDQSFGSQNNLSVSGSIQEALPFRASVGYETQDGILKTSEFDRLTAFLKLTPELLDGALKLDVSGKFSNEQNRFANEGAIGTAIGFDPTQSVYVEDETYGGYFEWLDSNGIPNGLAPRNPVALLDQINNSSDVNRIIANAKADYTLPFFKDLTATINVGYDKANGDGSTRVIDPNSASNYNTAAGVFDTGTSYYEQERTNTLLDTYLTYKNEFEGISSNLNLVGGYSWQKFANEGFNDGTERIAGLDNAGEIIFGGSDPYGDELFLLSFFGRANFDINDKYLFTATLRRDGTSRFSEENRWGNFPSAAIAWKVSEEPFFESATDLISNLKLRAGWGITGQQSVGGLYPYIPTYSTNIYDPSIDENSFANYIFGNQVIPTYRPNGYNVDLKWEETTTWNGGVDIGFAQGRYTTSFDLYEKESVDLLSFITLPAGTNFTNALDANIGDLVTKGWEWTFNGAIVDNQNFTWDFNANLSYNDIEITTLTLSDDPDFEGNQVGGIGGAVGNTIQINSEGFSPNTFYVYRQVYNASGEPIEGLYADLNGSNILDAGDFYRYENPNPDYFYGFGSNFYMGNWDASFAFRGSQGNYVYNNVRTSRNLRYIFGTESQSLSNTLPSVVETGFQTEQFFSDYFIENASFLKLDNVSLGYRFENTPIENLGMKLFATANNVFIISDYSGLDPEIAGGIDNTIYPRARTFSLGLTADF